VSAPQFLLFEEAVCLAALAADLMLIANGPLLEECAMAKLDRHGERLLTPPHANRSGEPTWSAPTRSKWDYTLFGRPDPTTTEPDEAISLKFEKIPEGRGGYNRWTINGKSWPDTNPLFTVTEGRRYRLLLNNNSGDEHPVHLHRHSFEITKVGDKKTSGVIKDTISMPRSPTAEVDFVADDPGPTFFHCHHQDHMDEGFAGLIVYR
jgi:FtsP/CotA-like multicopper oxidase with cupredoxin domain